MIIETTQGNKYSYIHRTNEIKYGECNDTYSWSFEPFRKFNNLNDVSTFVIGITEECNLRCKYCCYSGDYKKSRTHSSLTMSYETIEEVYGFIKKITHKWPLRVAFYGGEPLLHFDIVKYAISLGKRTFNKDITFSVSTNGICMTPDVADWLVDNDVDIDLSIDGTKVFHDNNRVFANGSGSYDKVYRSLKYLLDTYPIYYHRLRVLMTLPTLSAIDKVSEEWSTDPILAGLKPSQISSISSNFEKGVDNVDYEQRKQQYIRLLEIYQSHPDRIVLKAFFDGCISYWINRPILEVSGSIPMSTCLPTNTKLYIDTKGKIGVCEKIADIFRIGDIRDGIDYGNANNAVEEYYNRRLDRCSNCEALRMCDMCLTALEFDSTQWDVLCRNEKTLMRLHFWLFCEMAERGLLNEPDFPTLATERFELSELSSNDIPSIHVIMNDEETRKFLPELSELTKTDAGIQHLILTFKRYFSLEEGILWGIRNDCNLIGLIGIVDMKSTPTVFYAIHPQHRRMGCVSECLFAILNCAHSFIKNIVLSTHVIDDNVNSKKIIDRFGVNRLSMIC